MGISYHIPKILDQFSNHDEPTLIPSNRDSGVNRYSTETEVGTSCFSDCIDSHRSLDIQNWAGFSLMTWPSTEGTKA